MTVSLQLALPFVSYVGLQQNFCFINCHPMLEQIILTIADLRCFVGLSKVVIATK